MKLLITRFWKETQGKIWWHTPEMVALAAVAATPQLTAVISNVFNRIGSLVNSSIL